MKTILSVFLVLILSFSGCSEKTTHAEIKQFEKKLGKENTTTLSFLVKDFENNFLSKEYPKLKIKEAYQKIIEEVKNGENHHDRKISSTAKQKFLESQLINEIYTYVDSVWLKKELVNTRHIYKSKEGIIILGTSQSFNLREQNKDSLINFYQNTRDFNHRGKFILALQAVANKKNFLAEYYEIKQKVGNISNSLIPYQIEKYNIDYSDYFVKRILILELFYI